MWIGGSHIGNSQAHRTRSHGVGGLPSTLVAHEAMERGHGQEACLVDEISMRSHGVWPWPWKQA